MKKTILYSAATLLCGFVSCNNVETPPAEGSKTGFALSFFKNVNATADPDENIVVSPYSAGVALSMLTQGAEGQTRVELDNALNGCDFKAESFGAGDTVVVRSANSLWIDDDFSVRNHYVNMLEKDYDALATTLNFSDPATAHAINNWCSEHTDGKVNEVIKQLPSNIVMMLANAVYFKAPWLDQFNERATRDEVFHGQSGDRNVRMMNRKGRYAYAEYQGAQMIELPYEGGRYSMYLILPPADMKMKNIGTYLNQSVFESAVKMLAPAEVRFSLPKMKLETSLNLNNTLKSMGVVTAFGSAADFKGISAMGPLSLGDVAQKCYIDVTESGTEAAAVTTVSIALTSARPEMNVKVMKVDRPFLFMIADKESDIILFAGKIIDL